MAAGRQTISPARWRRTTAPPVGRWRRRMDSISCGSTTERARPAGAGRQTPGRPLKYLRLCTRCQSRQLIGVVAASQIGERLGVGRTLRRELGELFEIMLVA